MDRLEVPEQRASPERVELRETREHRDSRVFRDLLDLKVSKVNLETREPRDSKGHLEILVTLGRPVSRVQWDLSDNRVILVLLEPPDQ